MNFTIYERPQPQGSSKAFVIAGKARITSTNAKMKPFRSEVTRCVLWEMSERGWEMIGKHVPVRLMVDFYFLKPPSVSAKRTQCVVAPDVDKLLRCISDSLTGAAYHDDAQVVEIIGRKLYGLQEKVEISVEAIRA